jgi:hypothetical protein
MPVDLGLSRVLGVGLLLRVFLHRQEVPLLRWEHLWVWVLLLYMVLVV